MKAVLISVQPKWCELIASGKKTVEVRKTKPKIEIPFKCYIYCTQNGKNLIKDDISTTISFIAKNSGKVIGEFVCDRIDNGILSKSYFVDSINIGYDQTCVSIDEVAKYLDAYGAYGAYEFYGWHISDFIIYDKPKELYEFQRPCNNDCDNCEYLDVAEVGAYEHTATVKTCLNIITRPPQSYMYVEELR